MKKTKILTCFLGALLLIVVTGCEGCKKDDSTPKANLEDGLTGYWFKLNSSYTLIEDSDGYIWGVKIEESGDVTMARWNYSAGTINTEANGALFQISTALDDVFTGSNGEENITGTYNLSTTFISERNYSRMYFYSNMLSSEYLPGGHAGDWSVNGYYAKTFNLDASDAEITN